MPPDESKRLAALRDLGILDSAPEGEYDAIVRAASLVCHAPVALVSLVDSHRQWLKANLGLPGVTEHPRDVSFCAHTILQDGVLEVVDTTADPRFADNRLVLGDPSIRFYAGVPLHLADGSAAGALCVIDRRTRRLSEEQRDILRCLARAAESALENWRLRRAQLEAVAASEENLRRHYEATPAMLQTEDAEGRLKAVSDAWLLRLGYARREVIGRRSEEFLAPDSIDYLRNVARPILARLGRCDDLVLHYRARGGELVDMRMSVVLDRLDEAGPADGAPADGASHPRVAVIEDITARRRAERALEREQRRLANLLDATGAGTVEWNARTGETRVSDRWAVNLGWTPETLPPLSGPHRADWVHPDDLARITQALERHLAGEGAHYEYEVRLRHRDGHHIWMQTRGAVITRTEDGAAEWIFSTVTDITEHKRQEAALQRSEAFLERTGQLAGVGGWEVDLATGALTWSAETYRIHGLPPGSPVTVEQAIAFYAPEGQKAIRAAVEASMEGGPSWDLELALIRADGQQIWVHAVGTTQFAEGRPARLVGAFQDITERVAESAALHEAHQRLELAVGSGRIGIWELDFITGAHRWDEAMYRLYGRDPAGPDDREAMWRDSLHPDDRAATEQAAQDAIRGVRPYDTEFRIIWPDGSIRHIRGTAQMTRDAAGQALRMVGATWDVTESRRLEAALAEEHRRLSNVIAAADVGTWEWHIPTGEFRVNERWAGILGWTLAELAPISVCTRTDLMHPADQQQAQALLERHFADPTERYEFECRMRLRDGGYVWVQTHGTLMERGPDGAPERMFGIMKDISERRRQEEALRRSEAFLERAGRAAGVGGWELDLATGALSWTAETCRLHGVPPDYRPSLDRAIAFYAPEGRTRLRAAIAEAAAGGAPFDLELALIRADGERIWVRSIGAVELADGRPVRLAGAIQDITARVAEREALRQASERAALATESGQVGVWDWDIAVDTLVWDAPMFRLYGLCPSDGPLTYETWRRAVHPQDRAAAEQAVRAALDGTRGLDLEFRIVWPDASLHHIHATSRVSRDATGLAVRMVGLNWDVTEARMLAEELARQHEQLRVTLESIGDAVITTDAQGCILWLNPVGERLTGWPAAEARGRRLDEVFCIVNEETRAPAENPVHRCLADGGPGGLAHNTVLIARHGEEYGIEDSAAPIRNAAGEILGVVLVFHDVTQQRRISGEISYRASHDPLTGLLNRGEFEVRLRFLLHKSQSDRTQHALLFIDLDQFKLVNDACGHAVGDRLLQQVARLLSETVRASDTLARLGGDEFAVILDHCAIEPATQLGQRFCERMEDFRFIHEDRRFRIGASIGLVAVDGRWAEPAAVLQAADRACYAAKEAGRNRVHLWSETDRSMRARDGETQLAARLAQALDENRFVLFAQRIRKLRSRGSREPERVHAEVLLRMQEADGSLASPAAFLPAAERFHLATRIDRWVLERVVRWMQSVPTLGGIEVLSVNLSGQSVGDRAFHAWAMEVLEGAGPTICGRLCLEITETAAITNLPDAAAFISQVHGIGVRVALDDFGAGAASFGYLKTLAVDFLKIDGQFIRDLVADPLDEAAVRCFAEVAEVVGMRTVAEFVDHPKVLAKVRTMGIDFAQGFLIHRPSPIEDLLAMGIAAE
jgi:diguanylate cyclase (GGDEF)-like protein/PAS domain S-box-containing protein